MAKRPLSAADLNARARAAKLAKTSDLAAALDAYQAAIALSPEDPDLLAEVARVAERVAAHQIAAQLWAQVLRFDQDRPEAVDGQARALRELGRFDEAIELLRATLLAQPGDARLWNALGVTLVQQGDGEAALTFLDEAVRLDPKLASAIYNRAGLHFDAGRLETAAADYAAARKASRRPDETAAIDFALALLALTGGDLATGWTAYEARFAKALPHAPIFEAPGRRWTPDLPLEGRRLLVIAEQGVGDELMFLTLLPDVLPALGTTGRLDLAVDARLVPLYERSFPGAAVSAHVTGARNGRRLRTAPNVQDPRTVDLWTPAGSLARRFRTRAAAFAAARPLTPNPARVAHWRAWLGEGPAVGVSWRSGRTGADRRRLYPSLDDWAPVLRTPGRRLVNVQYGAEPAELARLAEIAGRPILDPPGIDLREDLDDLAALLTALEAVVSVGNATAQLAGACGRPLILISPRTAWTSLGTDGHPWHPSARLAACDRVDDWSTALAKAARLVGDALTPPT